MRTASVLLALLCAFAPTAHGQTGHPMPGSIGAVMTPEAHAARFPSPTSTVLSADALLSAAASQVVASSVTAAGALFLASPDAPLHTVAYHSAEVVVDAAGGRHVGFVIYAHSEQKKTFYAYCPPSGPSVCADPAAWQYVWLTTDMPFIQIKVTPAGKVRLLLYNDFLVIENKSATFYRYFECDANCGDGAAWRAFDLGHTLNGGGMYTQDYPATNFTLDPTGRPRFVYHYGTEWFGSNHEYTEYMAGCDAADCASADAWWFKRLPDHSYMDDLERSQLSYTPDGRARLLTILDYGFATWLVYMECTVACNGPQDWTTPYPILHISSGPGHRSWTMAFDSQGRPRVAARPLGGKMQFLWCDSDCASGNWWTYSLDFGNSAEYYPTIAIDSNDRPRLTFQSVGHGIAYAWCGQECESGNSRWWFVIAENSARLDQEQSINLPADCLRGGWIGGYRPRLVLDAQDNPLIAYDAEYLMECRRFPNDPSNPSTYTETKWWGSRLIFFSHHGVNGEQEVPTGMLTGILPNYPNPFIGMTSLPFDLARAGHVRMVVYDLLGREVEVLLEGWLPAGPHRIDWVADGRAGGTYIARLQTPAGTVSRNLTLIR
jgi:hypothetical protein